MDLNEIRMQIDQLDQSILHLFEQRMELCQQVAAYKKAHHIEIFQEGREAVIMKRIGKAAQPQFMHAAQTLFSGTSCQAAISGTGDHLFSNF